MNHDGYFRHLQGLVAMIKAEKIWKSAVESRTERAEFLWRAYRGYSRRNGRPIGRYLDIGTGDLANAIAFHQRAGSEDAVGIDLWSGVWSGLDLARSQEIALVRCDAGALPFRDRSFELVTMISFLEHVQDPLACLSEALRVVAKEGELFIQFPNRYFPIEVHSGLFMHFYLPKSIRNYLADALDRGYVKDWDVPPVRKIVKMLCQLDQSRESLTAGFSYPESLLPESRLIGALSRVLRRLGIFRILPIGYLILVHPLSTSHQKNGP